MMYDKMEPVLKAKWTTALRSEQYKQGSGRLYDPQKDCYCVLGVLCVVAGIPMTDDGMTCRLSKKGLPTSYQPIADVIGMVYRELYAMGDNEPMMPFPQLADWIDSNL